MGLKIIGNEIINTNASNDILVKDSAGIVQLKIGQDGVLRRSDNTLISITWSQLTGIPTSFTPSAHTHTIANITNLQSSLDAKAPLASPALTGTPTAPTAAAATNTTQIATTAFVQTAVSNLIDTAPDALNTLNELAAALGDDPNFATTISTSLSNRLRIDINTQGLTSTQQGNGRTNLGLGTASTFNSTDFLRTIGGTVTGDVTISNGVLGVVSSTAGEDVFYVDGVNGRLFTVTDDLSGSLFSINTIAGLPVIEAFADYSISMGPFSNPVTINTAGELFISSEKAATQTWVASQGYTTNTGTVTSVSGAGGYGGLTLTGTVTTSGSLTLGGTPTGTWPIAVSGNAATATILATSRTLTIGDTGKTFNGSANVSWTLAEIGAYAATNPSGYVAANFDITGTLRPRTAVTTYRDHNTSAWSDAPIRSLSTSEDNWIYLDSANAQWGIYHRNIDSSLAVSGQQTLPANSIAFIGNNNLQSYISLADGAFFAKSITSTGTISASNFSGSSSGTNTGDQTTISGNAGSATVLQTARTLTIGNTGKTFNGSANVSWSLAEIGAQAAGSYLTAESDTLASVTGRGSSTTTTLNLARVVTTGLYGPGTNGNIPIWQYNSGNPGYGIVYFEGTPDLLKFDVSGQAETGTPDFLIGPNYVQVNGSTVWHAGNDGSGSGLDADLLDGNHASAFAVSGHTHDASEIVSGIFVPELIPDLSETYSTIGHAHAWTEITGRPTAVSAFTNDSGYITSSSSISGTSAGVLRTVSGTSSAELVRGNMGDNDQARILIGATASNAGYLEIATADDGTEPIYVRQYTGVFSTLTRTVTLLDGSGNTSFPGTVTATTFSGALSGNASTATSAATWTTARTLTIGNTGKSVNGSANVSWTLAEIGAYAATNPSGYITAASLSGYATTNYVDTAVANLVDTAPDTLNTLNELAAALGDDPNFATTISTSLGNRLRIDTNAQGLNSTQQANGRTNLGLGTAATSNTGDFATAGHTHTSLGSVNFNNGDLTNINSIQIGDPGPGEGLLFAGGNGWAIYESPNDLTTNSAGNLQFVRSTTRVMTLDTSNNVFFAGGNLALSNILISNQQNTDVDSGATRVIATISSSLYNAAFFDFVIIKGTNRRAGTVYVVHNGTNIEFTETSTSDIGDTTEVKFTADLSGGTIRLLATTQTNDWSIKTLVRGI